MSTSVITPAQLFILHACRVTCLAARVGSFATDLGSVGSIQQMTCCCFAAAVPPNRHLKKLFLLHLFWQLLLFTGTLFVRTSGFTLPAISVSSYLSDSSCLCTADFAPAQLLRYCHLFVCAAGMQRRS
jgi:hypothetical protein